MTRGQIKIRIRDLCYEHVGREAHGSPVGLNNMIDDVVRDLCHSVDGVYTTVTGGFVANQSRYCTPPIYKYESAVCATSTGTVKTLHLIESDNMQRIDSAWRTAPRYGEPSCLVICGMTEIEFYPIPNYSANNGGGTGASVTPVITDGAITGVTVNAGGNGYTSAPYGLISGDGSGATITMIVTAGVVTGATITDPGSDYTYATISLQGGFIARGYGVPDETVATGWGADSAECPLYTDWHMAIVYGVAYQRAQMSLDQDIKALWQGYRRQFFDKKAQIQSTMDERTKDTRTRHEGMNEGYYPRGPLEM